MFGGRWSRQRSPIGVDVGAHGVRLMQLGRAQASGRPMIVAAASAELPAEVRGATGERFQTALTDTVHKLLDTGVFQGRRAVSCLPAASVQYKNLRLPKMPADELKAAVEWEAADRLHLGKDSSAIQFFDAGEVRQGDELREEIILLAAPLAVVEAQTQALVACGLEPEAIDVVPAALARVAGLTLPTGMSGAELDGQVVIDVGYQSSKVLIARGGRIAFFKLIGIGGRNFDQAAAQALGATLEDAAERRRAIADEAADGAEPGERYEQLRAALRPVITELGREIGLCLRYYSVTFRGRRPEDAVLVGGEANNPFLPDLLPEIAGIAIKPTDLLAGFDVAAPHEALGGTRRRGAWAVAAGLSLRGEHCLRQRSAA